jgi:heterodisulfide reductase subunit B
MIIEESLQLQDPERIKRKGRPNKPRRLKTIVEEIREKIATIEAKKKKAANSSKRSQLRFFSKTNKQNIKN